MPSKSRALLDQLSNLKETLEGFSFENLSSEQALNLKQTFDAFRDQLESRVWLPNSYDKPVAKNLPSTPTMETAPVPDNDKQDFDFLISMVSHEVRTPLNGITGFADLLGETSLDMTQRKYLESIQSASATMLDIVNALMDYKRAREGNDIPVLVPFSPEQVLNEVAYLAQTLIVNRELKFQMNLPSGLPQRLLGDPSRLSQILMNLLGNAIKFTPQGKVDVSFSYVTSNTHCDIACDVRDTGLGIPKDALKNIFKPYSKVKGRKRVEGEGLGLGLSLVQYWIQDLGGEISVNSQPGSGSVFRFNIPYEIATDIPVRQDNYALDPDQERRLQGLKVLIFEDNPLNMKLAETRLNQWRCDVTPAFSALEGLKRLETEYYDIILMDLHMPELDGYEVSRFIRKHRREVIRKLPIIAITADITEGVHKNITEAGINDLVGKPFSPFVLAQKIYNNIQNESGKTSLQHADYNSADQEFPCLNLATLWQECNGDPEMMVEITRLFHNGILEFLGALKLHTKSSNYQGIRDAAHKVKAGLKIVEAPVWIKQVDQIHDLARQSIQIAKIRGLYESLLADYPRLEATLKRELKKYKSGNY